LSWAATPLQSQGKAQAMAQIMVRFMVFGLCSVGFGVIVLPVLGPGAQCLLPTGFVARLPAAVDKRSWRIAGAGEGGGVGLGAGDLGFFHASTQPQRGQQSHGQKCFAHDLPPCLAGA